MTPEELPPNTDQAEADTESAGLPTGEVTAADVAEYLVGPDPGATTEENPANATEQHAETPAGFETSTAEDGEASTNESAEVPLERMTFTSEDELIAVVRARAVDGSYTLDNGVVQSTMPVEEVMGRIRDGSAAYINDFGLQQAMGKLERAKQEALGRSQQAAAPATLESVEDPADPAAGVETSVEQAEVPDVDAMLEQATSLEAIAEAVRAGAIDGAFTLEDGVTTQKIPVEELVGRINGPYADSIADTRIQQAVGRIQRTMEQRTTA
jgi:hypothetical protein